MKNTSNTLLSFLVAFFLSQGFSAFSQGTVTGSVKDEQHIALPFTTIVLLSQKDSSIVKDSFTDEKGIFNLKNVPYGDYKILIRMVGFAPKHTAPFEIKSGNSNLDLGTITLIKAGVSLDEVTVKGVRPVLEKRPDRFVMNVTNSTYQSEDLLHIFKALPFMDVDGEAVAINGKTNVLVLVDNIPRPQETLTAVFQSMTGQDIERIEFITNPSAAYEGKADAVINIITKKGQSQGIVGYARTAISQGEYGNSNNAVNITVRKNKIVFNGMIGYNGGNYLTENYGYRILTLQSDKIIFNESPYDLNKIGTVLGIIGLDYTINKSHAIGLQIDGNSRQMLNGSTWHNRIEFSKELGGSTDSTLVSLQRANSRTNIMNYSINYRIKLDSEGKKLINSTLVYTSLDKYTRNEMQYQNIENAKGEIIDRLPIIRNTNPSGSSILVGQVDLQLPLVDKWRITSGFRSNFSRLESNPYQEVLATNNTWNLVPDFSYKNLYKEAIIAGYVGLQRNWKGFSLDASARYEHTTMLVEGVYERKFSNILPAFLIQRKFSDNYQLALNYKRSINRPSFVELTPYRIYLDKYTVLQGNPELTLQVTDAVNINANLKDNIFIDLDYSESRNSFSQLPSQRGDITVWQVINLNNKYYSTTLTKNYNLRSWWQGNCLVRGTYYTTNGQLNQEQVGNKGFAYIIGINNTFSLPRNLKLDIGINYRSLRPYGLAISRKRSFVRLALKGNLIKDKLQYTITITDPFKDDISGFNLKTSNLDSRFYTYSDSRRFGIGLTYSFGKNTVKTATEKKLESEELLNRAK